MREIQIKKNEAGQRLDKWLVKYMKEAPKSFFYKMLRKKNITLNGKKAEGNEKLKEDDIVRLFLADETIKNFQKEQTIANVPLKAKILYEDHNIILFDKPVGVLSQKAEKEDVSLVEMLLSYLISEQKITQEELKTFKPSICNRLDRNTSGIVVAGVSLLGLQKMSELFAGRSLHKYYRCIVKGEMKKGQRVSGYLIKDEATNKVTVIAKEAYEKESSVYEDASYIETEYRPIEVKHGYTLLEVLLLTGKTHQIRAHLAHLSHPLLGDFKYGDRELNERLKREFQITSQMLHAYRIEFPKLSKPFDAISEKKVVCEVPKKFADLWKAL